jgi:hypothetical protein
LFIRHETIRLQVLLYVNPIRCDLPYAVPPGAGELVHIAKSDLFIILKLADAVDGAGFPVRDPMQDGQLEGLLFPQPLQFPGEIIYSLDDTLTGNLPTDIRGDTGKNGPVIPAGKCNG